MLDLKLKRPTGVDPARLQRIQDLLLRYPDISEAEKQEILLFLKSGPPLDTAILSTVGRIKPQLARFREDHHTHFDVGAREYVMIAVVVLALVTLLAALWEVAVK